MYDERLIFAPCYIQNGSFYILFITSFLVNVQFLYLQFFYQILCYFYSRVSSPTRSKQYERALLECLTFMSACHFIRIRQYPPEIIIPYRFQKWRRWSRRFHVDVTHLRKLKSICKPNFNEICESTATVNFMYFLFQNERQAYSTSGLDSSLFVIICIGVSNVIQIKLPTARS